MPKSRQVAGEVRRVPITSPIIRECYDRFASVTHGALIRDDLAWNEYWLWDNDDITSEVYCNEKGVGSYCGGTCNETNISAQTTTNIAIACMANQCLAKPGMGVDEGYMIVRNEMNRVIAIANSRKSKMIYCGIYDIRVPYSDVAGISKLLSEKGAAIIEKNFDDLTEQVIHAKITPTIRYPFRGDWSVWL